jgi:hypothetical protein
MNKKTNKKVHIFTSAALNYLPKVQVLFESIRRTHPEWILHLLLADIDQNNITFNHDFIDEIHFIADLEIQNSESWIFKHSIIELATAIKPFLANKLLARDDCSGVIYFDPDIVLFSRLDDILYSLENYSITLTPHITKAEITLEGVMDNEISCLKHGVYNLGFIGIRADAEGKNFAKWWSERLYHFCRDDIPNGLFTDQRWIDLVPALFESVCILKSPRFNVAPWNIANREISLGKSDQYFVNGSIPLGFYHFTGFDSGAHQAMAKKNSKNNPAVFQLIRWYRNECTVNESRKKLPEWAYSRYSNGEKISRNQRLVYSERVDLQNVFPSPFDSSGYLLWWKSQGAIEYPEFFMIDSKHDQKIMPKRIYTLQPKIRFLFGNKIINQSLCFIKKLKGYL